MGSAWFRGREAASGAGSAWLRRREGTPSAGSAWFRGREATHGVGLPARPWRDVRRARRRGGKVGGRQLPARFPTQGHSPQRQGDFEPTRVQSPRLRGSSRSPGILDALRSRTSRCLSRSAGIQLPRGLHDSLRCFVWSNPATMRMSTAAQASRSTRPRVFSADGSAFMMLCSDAGVWLARRNQLDA